MSKRVWVSSASICPPTTTNKSSRLVGWSLSFHLPSHCHQRVIVTRWMVPRLPSALNHHQRVTTTRGMVPQLPFALSLPPMSHRDSLDGPSASICLHHHQ